MFGCYLSVQLRTLFTYTFSDEALKLMKPGGKYDEEGKIKYFVELWKKQKDNPEEISLKASSNPTRKDRV